MIRVSIAQMYIFNPWILRIYLEIGNVIKKIQLPNDCNLESEVNYNE